MPEMSGEAISSAHKDAPRKAPPQGILEAYDALGLAAREGIGFLDAMDAYMQAVQLPTYRRQDAIEKAQARFTACLKHSFLMSEYFHVSKVLAFEIEYIASLRTASVALAVERGRLGTGHWPQALAELVPDYFPDVPEDPFDGAPLRYKRFDGGFVVYSVGKDGVDDGGRERSPSKERKPDETYDITFTVER